MYHGILNSTPSSNALSSDECCRPVRMREGSIDHDIIAVALVGDEEDKYMVVRLF